MPHSPRLHDGRLYISNAGTGEVGEIELGSGRFNPIAFCPGFVRGLGFVGNDLLVGLSLPRQHRDFSGLPLDDRLKEAGQAPQCMVQVIDLNSGTAAHSIALGGVVRELYDITCIPNHRTPMVVGFAQDQINRMIQRGRDISIDELLAERGEGAEAPRPASTASDTKKRQGKVKS
jgi:uncharacterized protein (TIGR03032 family)